MIFCKNCLMPSSRPRITFNKKGLCNGCITFNKRKNINWKKREKEFLNLIKNNKKINKNQKYDCILAFSGGKDSASIALRLKYKYGLKVLLVTFNQLLPTLEGKLNISNIVKLGFDHIYIKPSEKVSRKLSKKFFIEYGNPKLHWNSGVNSGPIQIAVKEKIPLVFYAENGEAEYGGKILSKSHLKFRDYQENLKNSLSGSNPTNWVGNGISLKNLEPYLYPKKNEIKKLKLTCVYFAYFFPWDGEQNLNLCKKYFNFKKRKGGRNCGAFSGINGVDDEIEDLYYYMQFIKFGFGRAYKDGCRLLQRKKITKKKFLQLINKYDGEEPTNLIKVSKYMGISLDNIKKIIDKFRNRKYWKRTQNSWQLKYKPL